MQELHLDDSAYTYEAPITRPSLAFIFCLRREKPLNRTVKEREFPEITARPSPAADVTESECYVNLSLYDTVSLSGADSNDGETVSDHKEEGGQRKRPIVKAKPRVARHRLYLEHSYENIEPNLHQSQSLSKQISTDCKLSFKRQDRDGSKGESVAKPTSPQPPTRTVSLPHKSLYSNGKCKVCNEREPTADEPNNPTCCDDVTRRPSTIRVVDNDVYIGDGLSESDA